MNDKAEGGYTALMAVVKAESSDLVKVLLAKGAVPNARSTRSTALGIALQHGYSKIAELLISAGAKQ